MATGMAGIEALKGLSAGLKTRMEKAVEDFRNNLVSVRTGRASVHMLDQVRVDYYGQEVPLSQVAQLKTPEAQLIIVEPWEQAMVAPIEKAIRTAGLGFNPMHDGKVIRGADSADERGATPRERQASRDSARRSSDLDSQYSPRRQ